MKALQELCSAVGEYHGSGQGEPDSVGHIVLSDDLELVKDLSEEQNEDSNNNAHPLMFLYDCETTGLSIYSDNIIEIAAEVFDCPVPHISSTTYSSLVKTSRRIPAQVIKVTNITPTMIRGERPLSVVFPEFLDWLITTTLNVSVAMGSSYHPVLVSHNGFAFDFLILLAEVERRPKHLSISCFKANNIHFCDSLPHLRKMKKDKDNRLEGTKLGMEKLYMHVLKTELPGAHRALADVRAMKAVFTHLNCLSNIQLRTQSAT